MSAVFLCEVLLWPFGGICFTTRPSGRNAREKLVDDLYIVAAVGGSKVRQVGRNSGSGYRDEGPSFIKLYWMVYIIYIYIYV